MAEWTKVKTILSKLSKEDRIFCINQIGLAINDVEEDNYMDSNRQSRNENLDILVLEIMALADIDKLKRTSV